MTATRLPVLLALALAAGLLGWLVGERVDVPELPAYAPVTLALLALVELGMARVVRDRVQQRARPGARPLLPEQVLRAAVLAKASSPTGAVLAGGYLGLVVALLPTPADEVRQDALVAGVTAGTALLLVGAALLLERACRTPEPRD